MSWLFGVLPYLLALGSAALGIFSLLKDWHNYKYPVLRKAVAAVLCVVAGLTLVRQNREDNDRRTEKQTQAEAAKRLEGQVEAANAAQKANTRLFLDSFDKLSQKVSDLQTQAKTDELQKKLSKVQTELQATQKALAPGPKATLLFSFNPIPNDDPPKPLTDVTLPITSEGLVHVEFDILNPTDVTASDGELTLRICNSCKYATEPNEFKKLVGQPDTERNMPFERILPASRISKKAFDVSVPDGISSFEVAIAYRCRTCVIDKTALKGIVHLARPFVRRPVVPQKPKSGR